MLAPVAPVSVEPELVEREAVEPDPVELDPAELDAVGSAEPAVSPPLSPLEVDCALDGVASACADTEPVSPAPAASASDR